MAFTDKELRKARERRQQAKPEAEHQEDRASRNSGTFRYCPRCDAMVDDRATTCQACGASLAEEPKPQLEPVSTELTESDRARIYQEEKVREEARRKIKTEQRAKTFIVTVLVFFGLYVYGQNSKSPPAEIKEGAPTIEQSGKTKPAEAARGNPIASLSAVSLFGAYEDNEVAADEQYKGKILEVSGVVDSIGKDILNQPYIALSLGQPYKIGRVQCFFSDSDISKLAKISKGAEIRVRGKCIGKMGNILLHDCILGYPYGP